MAIVAGALVIVTRLVIMLTVPTEIEPLKAVGLGVLLMRTSPSAGGVAAPAA